MTEPKFAGMIQREEGRRLAALARAVPVGQAIVEIGSHTGLSTCWMAHASTAHVIAVDPWGAPRPGSQDDPFGLGSQAYQRFEENVTAERLWGRITPIRARGVDVAALWVQPVGLLFIDAVHEYHAVKEDYEAWAHMIPSGGWLAFHDYIEDPEHPYAGVKRAIEEHVIPTKMWDQPVITQNLWTAQRR